MGREITKLKPTRKKADVDIAAISALEVRLRTIESKLVELYEVTERNKSALREVKYELGDQVLVYNRVNLRHTEAIRRIIIRIVDLEQLDAEIAKPRSNSETE